MNRADRNPRHSRRGGRQNQWMEAGQPRWERLGLTVTADGAHTLWVDDPTGLSWPVPARYRG